MDGKLRPADVKEKTMVMRDGNEDLLTEDLTSSSTEGDSPECPTELLSELTIPSPNEDHDHKKMDLHQTTSSRHARLHFDPKDEGIRALPVYGPWSGKNDPPQHPPALLPTCSKPATNGNTYSSTSRSQRNTTSYTDQTLSDDLCAPILLACLFCNPLECLWATVTGCHACTLSLCSYLCGCQPTALAPLLNMGDCCGCLAVNGCCSGGCEVCSVCLPATECLDLAMEFSQMAFH